ncbi:MAG: ATP synthase F1 subunit epsilon [Deltaproteobacteria bacterium]|nr:ATP synthase F1 subunit epsilon [Deltaproteobacteria bacterium]
MANTLFPIKIFTPAQTILDEEILSLIAEDRSGYFGIEAGHINLLTVLTPTILKYKNRDGKEQYVAVNGGILKVENSSVTIAAREAVAGEDMARLEEILSLEMAKEDADERMTRVSLERIGIMMMRNFLSFERVGRPGPPTGV